MKTLVVALGGNALLQRGEALTAENQYRNIASAVSALARLARSYRLAIVHGNGPQVGLLALQNLAWKEVEPYPLDVLPDGTLLVDPWDMVTDCYKAAGAMMGFCLGWVLEIDTGRNSGKAGRWCSVCYPPEDAARWYNHIPR